MILHLKITGVLLILLALLHMFFPRYFNWKQELRSVSVFTREIMFVHTFFIAFIVLLMGLLCITSTSELATTALGRRIALGMGLFWIARLLIQFFGYSVSLWKGKTFETTMHVLFSLLWVYYSCVFIMTWLA